MNKFAVRLRNSEDIYEVTIDVKDQADIAPAINKIVEGRKGKWTHDEKIVIVWTKEYYDSFKKSRRK